MRKKRAKSDSGVLTIAGVMIERNRVYDLHLDYSQSYTGISISIPIRVVAAKKPGPTVCVCATVHGDELNGIGIIRSVLFDKPLNLERGTVIAVPVVNVLGLESHSRYLPDRRDLNRCFPGSARGSLSSRLAYLIFHQVIKKCDYLLDFHTAALRRTNYPNIRVDLDHPNAQELAHSFGCELIVHSKGAKGSLRRVALSRGIPSIVLEAGEVWKIEPGVVEIGGRGCENVFKKLRMMKGRMDKPRHQLEIRKSIWVRAESGGILQFHASPGDVVESGQVLATNDTIFGAAQNEVKSPVDGVVLGMTTMPAVKPGEPVFHIASTDQDYAQLSRMLGRRHQARLHKKVQKQLTTNIVLSEPAG